MNTQDHTEEQVWKQVEAAMRTVSDYEPDELAPQFTLTIRNMDELVGDYQFDYPEPWKITLHRAEVPNALRVFVNGEDTGYNMIPRLRWDAVNPLPGKPDHKNTLWGAGIYHSIFWSGEGFDEDDDDGFNPKAW